jgi:hypothetical protein
MSKQPTFEDIIIPVLANLSNRTMPDHGTDLYRAEEHVAEARRIVQQQKGRIIRLRINGAETCDAERTLRLLESNLRRFEEHRDSLKAKK